MGLILALLWFFASDDTATLQKAIDAGGTVQLQAKTYVLFSTLRITHPVIITGTKTALVFRSPTPLESGIDISASNVTISGLELSGEGTSLAHGIKINGGKGFQIDHVWVHGIHGLRPLASAGILMGNVSDVKIQNSTFTDIGILGRPGFAIWNYYKQYSNHILIDHNTFHDNQANIVVGLFDVNDSVVSNNVIDQGNVCVEPCRTNGYGILFYLYDHSKGNLTGDSAENNHVSNTAGSAIYFAGVDNMKAQGNITMHTSQKQNDGTLPVAAISLNGTTTGEISGNQIQDDARGGVVCASTNHVTIEDNKITNVGQWAIRLREGPPKDTIIRHNAVNGAPVSVIEDMGGAVGTKMDSNTESRVARSHVIRH